MFALVYTAGIVTRIAKWYAGWFAFLVCIAVFLYECAKIKEKQSDYKRRIVSMIMVCVCLFATAQIRYETKQSNRDNHMQILTDGSSVVVWGKIYKTEYKNEAYRYYVTGCSVQTKSAKVSTMNTGIIIYSDDGTACTGDHIMVKGNVSLFKEAANEGEFDRRAFYYAQMIDFAVKADCIETKAGRSSWFYHRIDAVRNTLVQSFYEVTDEKTAGILSSMIFGDKTYLDEDIKDLYQVTGISHILAISGVKTLKLDIPLVPETRINWAFVPLHIAIIYILKLCLDEEIIPRCRFPCSRGYFTKCINWQKKQ